MNLVRSFRRVASQLVAVGALPFVLAQPRPAQNSPRPVPPIREDESGKLIYTPDAAGNRVIDFSLAGYGGGGVAIPQVPARIFVSPQGPDDQRRIQAAIDLVGSMPVGPDGFRGAVLLKPGRYQIAGSLRLTASGVVLRGSGQGEGGTILDAIGQSRRTLIEIGGTGDRTELAETRKNVTNAFVPVGATRLGVEDASGFSVGARVVVRRPCTAA